MKDRVSIDLTDGVADVRLIRADKMNALDNAMFEGILEAGDRLRAMSIELVTRARASTGGPQRSALLER
jgi:enoyl-CoA hydratase/carnithine racemase